MNLVDANARRAIREDLGATLVVEAAAGTGKTTEMIARLIAVLRTGVTTLERIVAVTFTEKAAGEMKLRLRTELERARQAARGIEQQRLEAALAALEVSHIGSIHSFCSDVLRERPIEAQVDPLFEVAAEDEADALFSQAFETWFQACLAAPGTGVRRILRRSEPTELLRRAGWSLVDRRDFNGPWRRDPFDRDAAIDAVLTALGAIADLAHRASWENDSLAKLFAKVERWLAELSRRELVRARDYDGLEAELTEVNRWWEWKYSGRAKLYGAGLLRADVVAQRDTAKGVLEQFLSDAGADLATWLHEELQPLVHEYERLKSRSGQLDFLDLLAKTRNLLRDDRRVREELQARFSHFFVDEFQDTDPLQVDILLLLCAAEPADADPRTINIRPGKLFVVGDPKQAIYRFRRADIALYESVKARLLAEGATLLHLTTSFRSVPAIQSAVNAAFDSVMQGNGQAQYVPLERFRDDVAHQPAVVALPVPRPYGKRDISNYAIEESYPDAVGAFVDHLINASGWTVSERGAPNGQHPIAPRHICLMFRRFQSFGRDLTRPYVRALEARGIPHVLIGGRSFHGREEIEATRNALNAIEWPDDEFSVYATLRGPFFAFHDEDLIAFQHVHRRLHPLQWSDLERPDLPALTTDAFKAVASALSILGSLHRNRNRRPIADTLSRLLAATRAHAGLAVWPAGEQALANVFRVMDLGRRFEANGATSFRAFVERLDTDADRGRHSEAPVVEEGTEGVRIMTVHAAKGLEFPAVILCDPAAPVAQDRPSRYIDTSRNVWLEPLAGCVPTELREHEDEVLRRDREEGERLTYVAVTRARDLLVVPVVGDEERDGWLKTLAPVVHPAGSHRRSPATAIGCPAFGDDSVVQRPRGCERMQTDAVSPGQHMPRAGNHSVVWWDPNVLVLDRETGGGIRQQQVLQADESNELASASNRLHAEWQARRRSALDAGAKPSVVVRSVTEATHGSSSRTMVVTVETASGTRGARPGGKRFGILVHATLAAVDLGGDDAHVRAVAQNQSRMIGASQGETEAAITAIREALAHPLLVRAASASANHMLRREVPIVLATPGGLVEGVVDLAFGEVSETGTVWTVVDFKTDAEIRKRRGTYEEQVRLYATAIGTATGTPVSAAILIV